MANVEWEVYIDNDGDGFPCREAIPGDPLNLVPTPVTLSSIYHQLVSGGTLSVQTEETLYGLRVWRLNNFTGTFYLLRTPGAEDEYQFETTASGNYRVSIWLRGIDGWSGNIEVFVHSHGGAVSASTPTAIGTPDVWQRVDVAFTETTADYLYVRIVASLGTPQLELTGLMVVSGTAYPAGFNAGHPSNRRDRVTERITKYFTFENGSSPFETTANESNTDIILANSDRLFSPEMTGTDLEGMLVPARAVFIECDGVSMWRGITKGWQPDVNRNASEQTCKVTCISMKQIYQNAKVLPPILYNLRTDEVVSVLLGLSGIPAYYGEDVFIVDHPLYGTVDTQFIGNIGAGTFDEGVAYIPIFGDNLIGTSGIIPSLMQQLQAVMDIEAGGLHWNRQGLPEFWNRTHKYTIDAPTPALWTPDADFDDTFSDGRYISADADVINEVEVVVYPRVISGQHQQLFALPSYVTVPPEQTIRMFATFVNAQGRPITAYQVDELRPEDVYWQEGGGIISLSQKGQGMEISITGGPTGGVLAGLNFYGYTSTAEQALSIIESDDTLKSVYGLRQFKRTLKGLSDLTEGKRIAQFELFRRSWFGGRFESIEFDVSYDSTHPDDPVQPSDFIELGIGSRVRVREYLTNHNEVYTVVGEQFQIDVISHTMFLNYTLEPCPVAWLIGFAHEVGEAGLRVGVG